MRSNDALSGLQARPVPGPVLDVNFRLPLGSRCGVDLRRSDFDRIQPEHLRGVTVRTPRGCG